MNTLERWYSQLGRQNELVEQLLVERKNLLKQISQLLTENTALVKFKNETLSRMSREHQLGENTSI